MIINEGDMIIFPEGDVWKCLFGFTFKYVKGGRKQTHWDHAIQFSNLDFSRVKKYVKKKSNKPEWF